MYILLLCIQRQQMIYNISESYKIPCSFAKSRLSVQLLYVWLLTQNIPYTNTRINAFYGHASSTQIFVLVKYKSRRKFLSVEYYFHCLSKRFIFCLTHSNALLLCFDDCAHVRTDRSKDGHSHLNTGNTTTTVMLWRPQP